MVAGETKAAVTVGLVGLVSDHGDGSNSEVCIEKVRFAFGRVEFGWSVEKEDLNNKKSRVGEGGGLKKALCW